MHSHILRKFQRYTPLMYSRIQIIHSHSDERWNWRQRRERGREEVPSVNTSADCCITTLKRTSDRHMKFDLSHRSNIYLKGHRKVFTKAHGVTLKKRTLLWIIVTEHRINLREFREHCNEILASIIAENNLASYGTVHFGGRPYALWSVTNERTCWRIGIMSKDWGEQCEMASLDSPPS